MINKLNKEFVSGLERIKWFVSMVIDRIKIEMAIIKLLGKSEKYEKQRREALVAIGERVVELSGRKNPVVLEDSDIREELAKLEKLDKEINLLKKEVEDVGTLEA